MLARITVEDVIEVLDRCEVVIEDVVLDTTGGIYVKFLRAAMR